VKAAFALFCEHGYTGTTMAHIAEAAGVAVQTVYFTFHTKAAVLPRARQESGPEKRRPVLRPFFAPQGPSES
jgi:AcrR family transcriptional regulator